LSLLSGMTRRFLLRRNRGRRGTRPIWHDQGVFPSTPSETGRDGWADGNRAGPPGQPGPARGPAPHGFPPRSGPDSGRGDGPPRPDELPERTGPRRARRGTPTRFEEADAEDVEEVEDAEVVPIRRLLSMAIAGFAALLGVGLVFGAHTSGPGNARIPFAVVVFGVQLLFILAWTMATRPPALLLVAGVAVAVAAGADVAAVLSQIAGLAPLGYVAVAGFVAGVVGQLVRPADRTRVTESLGTTLLIVVGVVAFGTLIVLSRVPLGTQAIFVCLTATAVSLTVARLTDALIPWPRLAPQVPRGAAGVVIGAMCGTLSAGLVGVRLVGFTPTSAAVVGLVTAVVAALADLACGYAEAGRLMAGDPPTMWVARHMQGPIGGFALAAPAAYAMSKLFL
jgi:hypothetical protein